MPSLRPWLMAQTPHCQAIARPLLVPYVHGRSVFGIHTLEVLLRHLATKNGLRPWIRDVLDNILMIRHQRHSRFHLSKRGAQSTRCIIAHVGFAIWESCVFTVLPVIGCLNAGVKEPS